ncbi:MAG: 3-isopropylmalate dehydratase large subunit [Candidatus Obscuribacterales bacterium]|nr:3-isopropylmalate dehydratase large subunit [Candidatus Obscuribacterales bacterium]
MSQVKSIPKKAVQQQKHDVVAKKSATVDETKGPRNIVEKIWASHIVSQTDGHPAIFAVDLMLLHEVTSAQAFQTIEQRKLKVKNPERLLATIDHSIPTRQNRWEIYDEAARSQVETLRENCKRHGIPFFDYDSGNQGIVHVIGPELGATQPGMTIVCGDSHTSTHGAFGALAFGVGTSEVAHVMATGCLLQEKPRSMKVEFRGSLKKGVYSKDAVLKLISIIGVGGANGHVIEYTGEAISKMSMEERMTICNMSIECGARAGVIAPDEVTYNYLKGRKLAPTEDNFQEAVEYWETFRSDPESKFDKEVVIVLDELDPMITWGTNPSQGIELGKPIPNPKKLSDLAKKDLEAALAYTKLEAGKSLVGMPFQWAFVGSCTNGRIEDLRIAASILKGKKVAEGVTMYVVPGSESVRAQAIEEGLDKVFENAGAQFRMPGCSMCLSMNDDRVPPGERCVSSSNRNFMGRQGPDSITHLASPATVAASAIEGKITSPANYL